MVIIIVIYQKLLQKYQIYTIKGTIIFLFWMWNVRDVGYSGYGFLGMWNVQDGKCSGCGMFGMWDVQDVVY